MENNSFHRSNPLKSLTILCDFPLFSVFNLQVTQKKTFSRVSLYMLLMIDNYDSFTYNLVQYFRELGADVQVYRNDEISIEEIERLAPSHLVISPGPCTPNEAGISMAAIEAFAGKIPILGKIGRAHV